MHAQQRCNIGCHGEIVTAKATTHYHYLQGFGDRFAAFRTNLIKSQVEGDQGCVHLP
jgi:hypothetical protein